MSLNAWKYFLKDQTKKSINSFLIWYLQVGLDASDTERVLVDLINSRKQLSASAHGNIAAAEISDGHRAQVQRFGDKGGIAQVEGHKYGLISSTSSSKKFSQSNYDNWLHDGGADADRLSIFRMVLMLIYITYISTLRWFLGNGKNPVNEKNKTTEWRVALER